MFFNVKAKLAMLILGIVLVAGCASNDNNVVGTANGLEINNFTTTQAEIFSGSKTTVSLNIENQGESLVNAGNGGILLIGANEWNPTNVVRAFSKTLRPANTFTNPPTPAGQQIESWTLTAPVLGKGQSRPYIMTGRIYYDYLTTASGSIKVYPESEVTAAQDSGEVLDKSSFSVTRGPVSMAVTVAPDPVVVSSSGDNIFTLQITFTNVEDGIVYNKGNVTGITADGSDTTPFSIDSDALNMVQLSLSGLDGSKNLNLTDPTCIENIQLVAGSATIICDINVTTTVSVPTPYSIGINASYGYYTDQQLTITAIGK